MWKLVAAASAVIFFAACSFSTDVPSDAPGPNITIGFEKPTSVVDRKTGVHQIRVKLSEISTRDVTVHYQVTGGTATPPTDFDLITAETITIPAGEQYVFFEVKINPIADGDRPDQTIDISLLNPSGASIGLDKHEITILAKALPRVSFELDTSSAQEPADAVLDVKLDEMSEFDITVDYIVTPIGTYTGAGDYTLPNGTLTIPKGMLMATITLDVLQDALDEDDEGVQIVLENPTKAFIDMTKDRHTHTITDDDPLPTITFQANQTVGEAAGNITVGVTLSPVSGRPVTVPYAVANGATATANADYTITGTSLTFNPGDTTTTIAVSIVQDTTDEPTESFQIDPGTVVNANVGTPGNHVISITDDDQACYGAAPFAVCFDSAPTGTLAITTNINTSSPGGSAVCGPQPIGWTTAPQNQDAACVIARDTITIGAGANIVVTGNRPLVLIAATSITIDGTLDASSRNDVAGLTGAGAPSTDCDAFPQNPGSSNGGGGGGAGATFVSIGGAGGTGGTAATQGGTAPAIETTPLAKLRAGCHGQAGGNGSNGAANPSGFVGRGGGAVYVVTGGTLTLGATAVINTSGSGAGGGGHSSGGSGAGSGGMIKVFFNTLAATTGARILSNGGGGAGGGDVDGNGSTGEDPNPATPTTRAAGGPSGAGGATGGFGYAGGVAASAGDNGDTASANSNGGGGGGGGGGYLQSNKALTNVTVSAGVIQIP